MKKFWIYTAFIAVFAFTVWIFAERITRVDPSLNSHPEVQALSNEAGDVKLSDLKGKYVLVNFWDSHNAVSRIAAGEYDRFFRTHRNSNLKLLSVNTDTNRRLFNEIVHGDGLDSLTQYHILDVKARGISPGYHPEGGYSSYLVNPSGKIIAVNPTVQTVEKIIAKGKE